MKKKTTIAILLATTMMLALMGCGSASTDTSSSDAASVAEVNTDSESNTSGDTNNEANADASSDSASTDSSEAASTTTASSDASFEYNGQTLSILDDLQTTLDKLNSAFPNEAQEISNEKTASGLNGYSYDSVNGGEAQIDILTFDNNGTQTVGQIAIIKESFKTSKGIGIGSSSDDIIKAYGEPTTKNKLGNGIASLYKYKFGNYNLAFFVDDGKVDSINYLHPDFPNQ